MTGLLLIVVLGAGVMSLYTNKISLRSHAISQPGIDALKRREGLRLLAYFDGGGVLTIGYGHTKNVYSGQSITPARAEQLLREDLTEFEKTINNAVTVPLTQSQYDALVSFSFNVGSGAFRSSTLLRLLNGGDYTGASDQLNRWKFDNGVIVAGLLNRRVDEINQFWA